jgi:diguanylate cyclase (GGDEF)-like protein
MKILVADDDPVSSTLVLKLLQSWGYAVLFARDGNEAVALLSGPQAPRIALVDWTMPGQTGLEVCQKVRASAGREYTYLIMVTARGERGDILEGLNAGADDYLVKPIFPAELRARIEIGKRIAKLQEELLRALQTAEYQAGHDALTGLWNRRAILEQLRSTLAQAKRRGEPTGALLVDLDHFKTINDTRGHQLGDAALRHTAAILRSSVRSYDLVGRYGGDEFLIVAPNCEAGEVVEIGQRIVEQVAKTPLAAGAEADYIPLGVSVGAAVTSAATSHDENVLIAAADTALYAAKKAGRNQVCSQVVPTTCQIPAPGAACAAAAGDRATC